MRIFLFLHYFCIVPCFFLSVTGSRFDIQPAGSETASIASLALPAVPRSKWDCAKDQTRYQSGVHLLNSPTLLLLCIISHLCFETNWIICCYFHLLYIFPLESSAPAEAKNTCLHKNIGRYTLIILWNNVEINY